MACLRLFKNILVLLPLLFVWILFQISHIKNRNIRFEDGDSFATKLLNSTHRKSQIFAKRSPSLKKLNWMPPNLSEDDFYEFLKSSGENVKSRSPKKLWFMKGGEIRPEQLHLNSQYELWPEQNKGDRIVEQLMYFPRNYSNEWGVISPSAKSRLYNSRENKLKKILLIGNFERSKIPPGRSLFWQDKCPVNTCSFVTTLEEARSPDVVIFKDKYLKGIDLLIRRRPEQVWILYLLEPPRTVELGGLKYVINWTASYKHDSDIVSPYGKFVSYNITSLYAPERVKADEMSKSKNYASNKSKKVAWFTEDCHLQSYRHQYARNLSLYIEVDIYGSCGTKRCPYKLHDKCLELLDKDYKFYLSFENRNCKEYITEAFFENGLGHNILPIVMGPPREDYGRVAPPHSFIHVNDFPSPKELAVYLHILDANDALYNEYFNWKSTGELINTHFWCRLCALLHSPHQHKSYQNVQNWWSAPGVCETR